MYAPERCRKDVVGGNEGAMGMAYDARMRPRDKLLRDGGTSGSISRCAVASSVKMYTPEVCAGGKSQSNGN